MRLVIVLVVLLALGSASEAGAAAWPRWEGTPTGVARTAAYDGGEWIATNGIRQAQGANADGLDRTDYFKAVNPHGDDPTHISRDLYNALTYDFFGIHRAAHNGDYQLPGDEARWPAGTADLAEVRLAVRGSSLYVRFLWNAFPRPDAQIATLTFGVPGSALRAWPRNARLRSRYERALTVWGTGGALADGAGGGESAVAVRFGDHVTEARVPLDALPAGPWTLTGGAGLADPAEPNRYWEVPTGPPTDSAPGSRAPSSPTNVWALLFADDRPWTFDERKQADDLAVGSAESDTATVDPALLRAGASRAPAPRTGDLTRVFASRVDLGDGLEHSGGLPAGRTGFDETRRYRGRLQSYAMHVPERYPSSRRRWPLIIYLHGFANDIDEGFYNPVGLVAEADRQGYLLAAPYGRGDTFYAREGQVDVLEVLADVERRYEVDPDRVYLMGHSMGGYGTNRIATRFPDLFAAVAPAQGTESIELAANLRNLPWYETSSEEDLDAGARNARALYDRLSAAGYDATLLVYGMKIHEYSSIYDGLPELFRFFAAHRRSVNPAVVSWTRPTDDDPALGLVYDGAYWLSGVRAARGTAPSTVTVTSGAIAHGDADPAAAQRTEEVVLDPDGPTGRTIGRRYRTTPAGGPAVVRSDTLEVLARNTAALTVDGARANLSAARLRMVVDSDVPLTITITGLAGRNRTFDVAAGRSVVAGG